MNKRKILEVVFQTARRIPAMTEGEGPYTWGQVKEAMKEKNFELQDTDYLMICASDAYQDGDSARDAYWDISVERYREETDEELERRKQTIERAKKFQEERDRQRYLELKKRFGNE
jgi:hypothetical protein